MIGEIIKQTHGDSIDEGHLGGWAFGGDGGTYYPIMWRYLIENYNIKSTLDIGCGRGYSSKFFESLGCKITGIDGSPKAKEFSLIPNNLILHDYTIGTNNLIQNFDLGWSCEFVEHVESKYVDNFINDFKKCKYVAMTFAGIGQGGHHHVNENTSDFWINLMLINGFTYLETETEILRQKSIEDRNERLKDSTNPYFISHFIERGLFFKNNNL